MKTNLRSVGLDMEWLQAELDARNLKQPGDVLLALIDTDGSLYIAEQPPINALKAYFIGEGKDKRQGGT